MLAFNILMRLVQLGKNGTRRIALVQEPQLRFLNGFNSIYHLAREAAQTNSPLGAVVKECLSNDTLEYDPIHAGNSPWRLLTPIDHPDEPARCLVSGTGLTHLGSAKERNAMHVATEAETDSMKMFRWGLEGGRPASGEPGVAPEWFYKGTGSILRPHGEPLIVPPYAEDGGEEGEIAGIYFIDSHGTPRRVGMCIGNEFSDHRFEKKNYLNLAGSKIRTCALGPELVVDPEFKSIPGKVAIFRNGQAIWSKEILTGEAEMCHSLQNIEHHHFKYETHRRPGDMHVHYYGACSLSFGAGIQLNDGDVMEIQFEGFGRPLRNPLSVSTEKNELIRVGTL